LGTLYKFSILNISAYFTYIVLSYYESDDMFVDSFLSGNFKNATDCLFVFPVLIIFFSGCEKPEETYIDNTRKIKISDNLSVDMKVVMDDPVFNYAEYYNFLKYLVSSDRFLLVQQKDFQKSNSDDKVIISLRHDVDYNIKAAIKFAYFENKLGIKSTYFILHTAKYYGETRENFFKRNDNLIHYLKALQDKFGHEVGFHNDLVTLQVVFGLSPRDFLRNELDWMRSNNITVWGTSSHGSEYCYVYHYSNAYFWKEVPFNGGMFYNYEFVPKTDKVVQIEKDSCSSYNLDYFAESFTCDYFFADSDMKNGKRWNMKMVNLDTIKPGKKVILLLHPEHWD